MFDFVRLYWFDWFENRTHSKIGVRFCSIAEPNRTIGVRLGSIGFLFGFVRLDRSGLITNCCNCCIGVSFECLYRLHDKESLWDVDAIPGELHEPEFESKETHHRKRNLVRGRGEFKFSDFELSNRVKISEKCGQIRGPELTGFWGE